MARVLVIDDAKNIRKMVRLTLERAGHTVVTTDDGNEGLELFGTGQEWDVTLTDERLPGVEGHDLVHAMRQRAPLARIIMMTSFATFDLAVQVLQAGATDFLRKPFSTDLLRNTVALALDRPEGSPLDTASFASDGTTPTLSGIEYLINGVRFWPLKLSAAPSLLPGFAVTRTFRVLSFDTSDSATCLVGITPHVQAVVHQETGQKFPAASPLWDTVCRLALSHALWENREGTPEMVPVYELTADQLYTARQMAGMPFLMV